MSGMLPAAAPISIKGARKPIQSSSPVRPIGLIGAIRPMI
jgi:hypothetical protein